MLCYDKGLSDDMPKMGFDCGLTSNRTGPVPGRNEWLLWLSY